MSGTVTLPPVPREVPELVADPAGIRAYAADLLAASTQVDELGVFVAGDARVADWTGLGSTAYHDAIRPTGRRADAMSLALRNVARRVDQHAATLQALLDRRAALADERAQLVSAIHALRDRVAGATEDEAPAIQAQCDDCAARVTTYETDLDRWITDLMAEEEAIQEAFARVLTLDQVERRYGGVDDPADTALDAMPGPGASSREVNAWWDGLTPEQQLAIIAASPGSIGNRDGIPPEARDAANTVALDRDLADWGHLEDLGLLTDDERRWLDNARAAQDAIDTIEAGVDPQTLAAVPSQLYLYDPTAFDGDGAVAVAAGDLATAHDVAVTVPGFGTDGQSAAYQADRALDLYEATRSVDGTGGVATMFWIGYDAPDNLPWTGDGWDAAGVVSEDMATAGGDRLADLIDGLRDSRDGDPAHLTAIGHSYGSTTTGHAAHDEGIPVDDLVFVGSPGVGGDTDDVGDTGVDPDHVWAGANSRDPIADLGNHGWLHLETLDGGGLGDDPAEDDFGAIRFEAESTTRPDHLDFDEHSKYFDHGTESLYNLSQIVSGHYDAVLTADPVTDPWYAGPQDPEWDRDPTERDTLDGP
ncbi:alpha/beta hydrolase [Nocardioides hankookensis]|uniref:Alpha/beta hydrolase n=1 Tax=Nocardioides hankookensis TaxID=443157 RepID=A0ABW1LPC7_9ACTN